MTSFRRVEKLMTIEELTQHLLQHDYIHIAHRSSTENERGCYISAVVYDEHSNADIAFIYELCATIEYRFIIKDPITEQFIWSDWQHLKLMNLTALQLDNLLNNIVLGLQLRSSQRT